MISPNVEETKTLGVAKEAGNFNALLDFAGKIGYAGLTIWITLPTKPSW